MRHLLVIALALAGLGTSMHAAAQRLVVVSQALSATQEAARLYGHSVDMVQGGLLPGAPAFPGPRPVGALATWDSIPWGLMTTETLLGDTTSAVALAPFQLRSDLRRDAPPGYRERLGEVFDIGATPHAIFLGSDTAPGARTGYVTVLPFDPAIPKGFGPPLLRWSLDASPVAAVVLGDPPVLHVLGTADTGPVLASGFLSGQEQPSSVRPLDAMEDTAGLEASALAVGNDGRLWAMVHGFSFAQASGAPASWVFTCNPITGVRIASPVLVPGTAVANGALHTGPDGCCWVLTEARGPGFYYATRLCAGAGGLEKTAEYPLRLFSGGLHFLQHAVNGNIAVASGDRLEVWPRGDRGGLSRSFDGVVSALEWSDSDLVVAVDNELHLLDSASLKTLANASIVSGHIVALRSVAPRWTTFDQDGDGLDASAELLQKTHPFNPDTDGDGLHDGIDPEPTTPSPVLELPDAILFSGDAVGNEIRKIQIDPGVPEAIDWRVLADGNEMNWLRVYPNIARGAAPLFFFVDPEQYDGTAIRGALKVALEGSTPGVAAAGSPTELRIGVRPARGGIRRVLWVWGNPAPDFRSGEDPRGFARLAERLAAAPFYFSHNEVSGPGAYDLNPYGLVVLSAEAAAQGGLAPGELLDYVAQGGAFLLLGTGEDAGNAALSRLLGPAGMTLVPETTVAGPYALAEEAPSGLAPRDIRFAGGTAISADPSFLAAPDPAHAGTGVVVTRDYGLGRIAVLASPTPLLSTTFGDLANRHFSEGLFRWLARAGTRIEDEDGDGITSPVELAHGTDPARPDTDGDGVPDGMEDRNRNGIVDDGETDPRNLDSDGDGIFDGADAHPLPELGAPQIFALSVGEGPGEGGTEVVVTGRNLPHGAVYRFDDHPARVLQADGFGMARILTPEAETAGETTLHVVAENGEGALAKAFRYQPRSTVTLRFTPHTEIAPTLRNGVYEGVVRLTGAFPPGTAFNRLRLQFETAAPEGFAWSSAIPGINLLRKGMKVRGSESAAGIYEVWINPEGQENLPEGELLWLSWRMPADQAPGAVIRITPVVRDEDGEGMTLALNTIGSLLTVDIAPLEIIPVPADSPVITAAEPDV